MDVSNAPCTAKFPPDHPEVVTEPGTAPVIAKVRRSSKGAPASRTLDPHTKRCAIYTRKSTEEGLDQAFNSLDAQREACEAFIASQKQEGWQARPEHYDDGGFSGGSMDRPGLQALLATVDAGQIDVVVVYKVDRLTRSLADFAKIVERFDARGVSFVSVTQTFNTTTSMGRLTLNVLLSFAQFEREVGAERVRDKIAAAKKKGMWMGGPVPLGYRVQDRKLIVQETEAETVRTIFQLYLEAGSVHALLPILHERGIVTAHRPRRDGTPHGGIPFRRGSLHALLRNRIYRGELQHKGQWHHGEHAALLDIELFDIVQSRLAAQDNGGCRTHSYTPALLTGKIFDSRGNRMTPSHANKKGVRYRYYISRALLDGRKPEAGTPSRVSAPDIEDAVVNAIRDWVSAKGSRTASSIKEDGAEGSATQQWRAASTFEGTMQRPATPRDDHRDDGAPGHGPSPLIARHLLRLDVQADRLILALAVTQSEDVSQHRQSDAGSDLSEILHEDSNPPGPTSDELIIPRTIAAPTIRRSIAAHTTPAADRALKNRDRLLAAIYRARSWQQELMHRRSSGLTSLADRHGRHPRSIRLSLNLAQLAPDIIEGLISGAITTELTATDLARNLPLCWVEQRRMMGLLDHPA